MEIVRDFQPGIDDAGVADLWQRVFGAPRGGQTLEWLFRPGPAGASPRVVAEAEGRIVAHAGGAALRFRAGGRDVLGAYSVGAMTDPGFQGRGLFFRTGTRLYERLEQEGFAFVAGFSNQNSHRLMTGPLGRTAIRPFPWAVRLLRPWGIVRGVLGGREDSDRPRPRPFFERSAGDLRVREIAPDDPASAGSLDAVWRRASPGVAVGAVRDRAYVAWRYASRSDAGYRLLVVERAGEPAGFVAHRLMTLRGVPAGFLLDVVVPEGEAAAAAALLRAAADLARAEGAALLSALLPGSGPSRDALRAAGFLRVPERLHPQLIRFSVRGLGSFAGSTLLVDPNAWHLSWADTDVV